MTVQFRQLILQVHLFKLLTALAGYQMKVISDSTKFTCRHGYRMGRHTIGCHCGTYWYIGMEKAIEKSCNNYFLVFIIKSPKKYIPKGRNRAIDEWKEIMNSFGLGEIHE